MNTTLTIFRGGRGGAGNKWRALNHPRLKGQLTPVVREKLHKKSKGGKKELAYEPERAGPLEERRGGKY